MSIENYICSNLCELISIVIFIFALRLTITVHTCCYRWVCKTSLVSKRFVTSMDKKKIVFRTCSVTYANHLARQDATNKNRKCGTTDRLCTSSIDKRVDQNMYIHIVCMHALCRGKKCAKKSFMQNYYESAHQTRKSFSLHKLNMKSSLIIRVVR